MVVGLSALLAMAVCACASAPALETTPVRPAAIAPAAGAPAMPSALDVERFTPVAPLDGCTTRALPRASAPLPARLQDALAEAQRYSEAEQGLGLIVLADGALIHESYAGGGGAQVPSDSYSMHKSVLALAYGAAIAEGLIASLDDPVSRYIEEWRTDPRGAITLRQLLHMESGLRAYRPGDADSKSVQLMQSSDINEVALGFPLSDPPGTVFKYNNVNSQLAGLALERAITNMTGGGYPAYLWSRIWCPIGAGPGALWLDREGGSPHYFAGLFTTLDSWARLGELIRLRGVSGGRQVLPADWFDTLAHPAPTNPAYGLHIWRGSPWRAQRGYASDNPITVPHAAPYLAEDVLFFDGFGGQRVYVVPSAGLTIARIGMVNLKYDDSQIVNTILAALSRPAAR